MRNFSTSALVALATGFCFSSAHAAASLTCRDFATTAADQWAQDLMTRAADAEQPNQNQILVIAAGQKSFVPKRQPDELNLHLIPVGQRMIERNRVYDEELARCLGAKRITITVSN
jgi:hypothetical protein